MRSASAGNGDSERGDLLLDVRDLVKHFPVERGVFGRTVGHVKAVDGVSLQIPRDETLGLVGESGCGPGDVRWGRCAGDGP